MIENIEAMEAQGAEQWEIQEYLDGLGSASSAPSAAPTPSAPPPSQGMGAKLVGGLGKIGSGMSEFIAGNTGRAVGGLITQGIGATASLLGSKEFGPRLEAIGQKELTPKQVGLSTLEMYPGGALGRKTLLGTLPKLELGATKLGQAINKSLSTSAVKQYVQALGPTTEKMKRIAEKVAPEMLNRGVKAWTLKGLGSKTASTLEKTGEVMDVVLEKIPKDLKVPTGNIINTIRDFKGEYLIGGMAIDTKGNIAAQLKAAADAAGKTVDEIMRTARKVDGKVVVGGVEAEPKAIQAADALESVVRQMSEKGEASFASLRSLRQIWDKTVAKAAGGKGFLLDELGNLTVEAKKAAANAIRTELSKASPELAKVNKEYSFWKNVVDVTEATVRRREGQSVPLGEQLMTAAGAAGGLASGGIGQGVTFAVAAKELVKLVRSTAYRTRSAKLKWDVASAIAEGRIDDAITILSKIVPKFIGGKEK